MTEPRDRCTCLPYAFGGDGPEEDCPVHGRCNACYHSLHDDEAGCGYPVLSGLYGSDGMPLTTPCRCTDPSPDRCGLCGRVPADGEQHRQLYAVGHTGEDAEEVCVGPDRRQLDYAPLTPDPWALPGPQEPPPF